MRITKFLSNIVEEINSRFSIIAGPSSPKNKTLNAEKATD